MKQYQFTREAKYIEFGCVTAKNEEEARKKVEENDYDDIFDTSLDEEFNDTIKIEEDGETDE